MNIHSLRLVTLALFCGSFVAAQTTIAPPTDDTQLKQVIIYGRHSVRAPVASNMYLNQYSEQNFPDFLVPTGFLTTNGEILETILGGYYRQWLTQEGLLTGNDMADANFVYFHANAIQRTVDTAQHFWSGLLPHAPINVHYLTPSTAFDPLFDPVDAGVAQLNPQIAAAAVMGRLGSTPQVLASAYAPEFALSRSVLFGYPLGQTPLPTTPANKIDATDFATNPIVVTAAAQGLAISLGGLSTAENAVDAFPMEYGDGLQVGWGQLSEGGVSQVTRVANLTLDLEYRTPYLAAVQSSNVASHIVRSLEQASTSNALWGALGNPSTKVIVLIASDVNVCALAGLFHIDWLLPGYQQDFCSPGGALVLQLRQSRSNGQFIIRGSYIGQTLDQLRNQTPLTLAAPPGIAPVFIPGCSTSNATFDCPLSTFVDIANQVIDPQSADLVN
jgi:4-phytase / acid phosphatase